MLTRLVGKSKDKEVDTASRSSRRQDGERKSTRHRSVANVSSDSRNRGDDHDREFNPTSTRHSSTARGPSSGTGAGSVASSYVTAPSGRMIGEEYLPSGLVSNIDHTSNPRSELRDRDEDESRRRKSGRKVEKDRSRERIQSREPLAMASAAGNRRKTRGLSMSDTEPADGAITGPTGSSRRSSGPSRRFSEQIGSADFEQFPGQFDGPSGFIGTPTISTTRMSDHVQDQFPGQFPMQSAAPYRPPLGATQGRPGLAADYYLDNGQSVVEQPGIRPNPPTVIFGAEPHLQPASSVAAPPPEPSASGGVGAAASFFSEGFNAEAQGQQASYNQAFTNSANVPFYQQDPSKLPATQYSSSNRPDNNHSISAPAIPTLGAAAAGAAAGYLIGSQSSHQQHSSVPGHGQGRVSPATNYRPQSHSQNYAPIPGIVQPIKPSKHSSPSISAPLNAAGIAGVTGLAAAAYQHNNHSVDNSSMGQQYSSTTLAQRHRHHGPFSKLVDFFIDPDGVAQFEEYSEYIGVCRYCFAPGSSPRDAPRKHHYRRYRSNERYGGRARVDKERRYWSSDGETRQRNKQSWFATGIAGYGLAKAAEGLFNRDYKRSGPNQSPLGYKNNRSPDRKSYSSHGVTRRSSEAGEVRRSRSKDRFETGINSDGNFYKRDSHGGKFSEPSMILYDSRRRSKSRSRSRSNDRKRKVVESAIGTAAGSSVFISSSRRRSLSPRKAFVRSKRGSDERRSDRSSILGVRKPENRDGDRRSWYSPSSPVDGSKSSHGKSSKRRLKSHKRDKKNKGFFNFSYGSSSSSSHEDLAFDIDSDRRRNGSKSEAGKRGHHPANTALMGLGVAAAALALNETREKNKSEKIGELVAVKESKHNRSHSSQRDHQSKKKLSSSNTDEDLWESASEGSSADSNLAYGYNSRRASQESISSGASGMSKWGWRWGGKRKERQSTKRPRTVGDSGVPIRSGASILEPAAAASFVSDNRRYSTGINESSSVPLELVDRVSTSDHSRFDAVAQRSAMSSNPQTMIPQSVSVPIQHPQPKVSVPPAVYASQPPFTHSYSAPVGGLVSGSAFAEDRYQSESPNFGTQNQGYVTGPEEKRSGSFPHGDRPPSAPNSTAQNPEPKKKDISSSVYASELASDSIPSRRRNPHQDQASAVRFDMTEGQNNSNRLDSRRKTQESEDRRERLRQAKEDEDRERLRQQKKDEDRRERARQEQLDQARSERRRQERENEDQRERLRQAKEDEDRERLRQQKKDEDRRERARQERENEDQRERFRQQKEDEERRERIRQTQEDEVLREKHWHEQKDDSRQERRRQKQESKDHSERLLEREEEEKQRSTVKERKESGGKSKKSSPGDIDGNGISERTKQEIRPQVIEIEPRRGNSWAAPVAAGIIGAAIGAAAESKSSKSNTQRQNPDEQDRREREYRNISDDDEKRQVMKEEPLGEFEDIERKDRSMDEKSMSVWQAAAKLKRSSSHEDYAAYFTPPELLSRSDSHKHGTNPNADNNIVFSEGPEIVTIEPTGFYDSSYSPAYSFTPTGDETNPHPLTLPWVPTLRLIAPTPTPSRAGSINDRMSPISQPSNGKEVAVEEPSKPTTDSKVTWGEPQTIEYVPITPTYHLDQFIESPSSEHGNEIDTWQVPDVEDTRKHKEPSPPRGPMHKNDGVYDDDLEFAAVLAAGLEDTGFDPAVVIDDPSFRRRNSPPGSEQSGTYGSPSKVETGKSYPQTRELVSLPESGPVEGETPSVHVPGAFNEDEDEDTITKIDRNQENEAATRKSIDNVLPETHDGAKINEAKKISHGPEISTLEPDESVRSVVNANNSPKTEVGSELKGFEQIKANNSPKTDVDPGPKIFEQLTSKNSPTDVDNGLKKFEEHESKYSLKTYDDPELKGFEHSKADNLSNTDLDFNLNPVEQIKAKKTPQTDVDSGDDDLVLLSRNNTPEDEFFDASRSLSKNADSKATSSEFGGTPAKSQVDQGNKEYDGEIQSTVSDPLPRKPRRNESPEPRRSSGSADLYESPSEDAVSVAATAPVSNPVDETRKTRRKSKRRSSDFADSASLASSSRMNTDGADAPSKGRKEKKGLFGFLSRSSEEPSELSLTKERSKEATVEALEESKRSKDSKDRRSSRHGTRHRSRHGDDYSNVKADPPFSPEIPEDDYESRLHKSKGRKDKVRSTGGSRTNDSGRISQDLPAKDQETSLVTETLVAQTGDSLPTIADKQSPLEDSQPVSFLGKRQEIPPLPDSPDGSDFWKVQEDISMAKISSFSFQNPPPRDNLSPNASVNGDLLPISSGLVRAALPSLKPENQGQRLHEPQGRDDSGPHTVTSSPTAIPVNFRRPPPSPASIRSYSSAPLSSNANTPVVPFRQKPRPRSTEFRSSNEFRPLWLVERHGSRQEPSLEETYPSLPPSLPSSHSNSRSSSIQDPEDNELTRRHTQIDALDLVDTNYKVSTEGRGLMIDTDQDASQPDLLDSQQPTPTALFYDSTVKEETAPEIKAIQETESTPTAAPFVSVLSSPNSPSLPKSQPAEALPLEDKISPETSIELQYQEPRYSTTEPLTVSELQTTLIASTLPVNVDLDSPEARPQSHMFEPMDLGSEGLKPLEDVEEHEASTSRLVESSSRSQVNPQSIALPLDDNIDLIDPLPESPISKISGKDNIPDEHGETKDLDEFSQYVIEQVPEVVSAPKCPSNASMEIPIGPEQGSRDQVAIEETSGMASFNPESIALPLDDDIAFIDSLPESPIAKTMGKDKIQDEHAEAKHLDEFSQYATEEEASDRIYNPESIALPVDDDIDFIDSLPESPITKTPGKGNVQDQHGEAEHPDEFSQYVVEQVQEVVSPPKSPLNESTEIPIEPEQGSRNQVATEEASGRIYSPIDPESIALPVDDDIDFIDSLPESPTTKTSGKGNVPDQYGEAEHPDEFSQYVVEQVQEVVSPPKSPLNESTEIPIEPEQGSRNQVATEEASDRISSPIDPESIALPVDDDIDFIDSLPESPMSKTMGKDKIQDQHGGAEHLDEFSQYVVEQVPEVVGPSESPSKESMEIPTIELEQGSRNQVATEDPSVIVSSPRKISDQTHQVPINAEQNLIKRSVAEQASEITSPLLRLDETHPTPTEPEQVVDQASELVLPTQELPEVTHEFADEQKERSSYELAGTQSLDVPLLSQNPSGKTLDIYDELEQNHPGDDIASVSNSGKKAKKDKKDKKKKATQNTNLLLREPDVASPVTFSPSHTLTQPIDDASSLPVQDIPPINLARDQDSEVPADVPTVDDGRNSAKKRGKKVKKSRNNPFNMDPVLEESELPTPTTSRASELPAQSIEDTLNQTLVKDVDFKVDQEQARMDDGWDSRERKCEIATSNADLAGEKLDEPSGLGFRSTSKEKKRSKKRETERPSLEIGDTRLKDSAELPVDKAVPLNMDDAEPTSSAEPNVPDWEIAPTIRNTNGKKSKERALDIPEQGSTELPTDKTVRLDLDVAQPTLSTEPIVPDMGFTSTKKGKKDKKSKKQEQDILFKGTEETLEHGSAEVSTDKSMDLDLNAAQPAPAVIPSTPDWGLTSTKKSKKDKRSKKREQDVLFQGTEETPEHGSAELPTDKSMDLNLNAAQPAPPVEPNTSDWGITSTKKGKKDKKSKKREQDVLFHGTEETPEHGWAELPPDNSKDLELNAAQPAPPVEPSTSDWGFTSAKKGKKDKKSKKREQDVLFQGTEETSEHGLAESSTDKTMLLDLDVAQPTPSVEPGIPDVGLTSIKKGKKDKKSKKRELVPPLQSSEETPEQGSAELPTDKIMALDNGQPTSSVESSIPDMGFTSTKKGKTGKNDEKSKRRELDMHSLGTEEPPEQGSTELPTDKTMDLDLNVAQPTPSVEPGTPGSVALPVDRIVDLDLDVAQSAPSVGPVTPGSVDFSTDKTIDLNLNVARPTSSVGPGTPGSVGLPVDKTMDLDLDVAQPAPSVEPGTPGSVELPTDKTMDLNLNVARPTSSVGPGTPGSVGLPVDKTMDLDLDVAQPAPSVEPGTPGSVELPTDKTIDLNLNVAQPTPSVEPGTLGPMELPVDKTVNLDLDVAQPTTPSVEPGTPGPAELPVDKTVNLDLDAAQPTTPSVEPGTPGPVELPVDKIVNLDLDVAQPTTPSVEPGTPGSAELPVDKTVDLDLNVGQSTHSVEPSTPDWGSKSIKKSKKDKKSKKREMDTPFQEMEETPEQGSVDLSTDKPVNLDLNVAKPTPSGKPSPDIELKSTKKGKKDKKSKKREMNIAFQETEETSQQSSVELPTDKTVDLDMNATQPTPSVESTVSDMGFTSTKKGRKDKKSKKRAMDSLSPDNEETPEPDSVEFSLDEPLPLGLNSTQPNPYTEPSISGWELPSNKKNKKSKKSEKRELEIDIGATVSGTEIVSEQSPPPEANVESNQNETSKSAHFSPSLKIDAFRSSTGAFNAETSTNSGSTSVEEPAAATNLDSGVSGTEVLQRRLSKKDKRKAERADKSNQGVDPENEEGQESMDLSQHKILIQEEAQPPVLEQQASMDAQQQFQHTPPRPPSLPINQDISTDDISLQTSPFQWGNSITRDSAVHISESPLVPDTSPVNRTVRDSGYQDFEVSPLVQSDPIFVGTSTEPQNAQNVMITPLVGEIGSSITADEQNHQSLQDSEKTSENPLNISVEVNPNYGVSVSRSNSRRGSSRTTSRGTRDNDQTVHSDSNQDLSKLQTTGSIFDDPREPSPVSSTTKERSSVLFQSSPSTREDFINQPWEKYSPVHDGTDAKDLAEQPRGVPDWTHSTEVPISHVLTPATEPALNPASSQQPRDLPDSTHSTEVPHNQGLVRATERALSPAASQQPGDLPDSTYSTEVPHNQVLVATEHALSPAVSQQLSDLPDWTHSTEVPDHQVPVPTTERALSPVASQEPADVPDWTHSTEVPDHQVPVPTTERALSPVASQEPRDLPDWTHSTEVPDHQVPVPTTERALSPAAFQEPADVPDWTHSTEVPKNQVLVPATERALSPVASQEPADVPDWTHSTEVPKDQVLVPQQPTDVPDWMHSTEVSKNQVVVPATERALSPAASQEPGDMPDWTHATEVSKNQVPVPATERALSPVASQEPADVSDRTHSTEVSKNQDLVPAAERVLSPAASQDPGDMPDWTHSTEVPQNQALAPREPTDASDWTHSTEFPENQILVPQEPTDIPEWTLSREVPTNQDLAPATERALSPANFVESSNTNRSSGSPLFGGPLNVSDDQRSPSRSPFASDNSNRPRLNTIVEYSPEDSPLHKKSRSISDVGSPERGVKSRRRSATPQRTFQHRMGSPLDTQATVRTPDFIDDLTTRLSWPPVDEDNHTVDLERSRSRNTDEHRTSRQGQISSGPPKQRDSERRSLSGASVGSVESISVIIRTPDQIRSASGLSQRGSGTPPLRRVDRSVSSDLRLAHKKSEAKNLAKPFEAEPDRAIPSSSTYDPTKDKGKGRGRDMADIYEGWGDVHAASPLSPTRPPSMRRRQSLQILDLETKLDQLVSENRLLQESKSKAEKTLEVVDQDRSQQHDTFTDAIQSRDLYLRQKDTELHELKRLIEGLQSQVSRLTEINEDLTATRESLEEEHQQRYGQLEVDHSQTHQQWQQSTRELDELRNQHTQLSAGMEEIVRHETRVAVEEKNLELRKLRDELEDTKEQVRVLQQQILASKSSEIFIIERDEDYFDSKCQELCGHVQQWVLRFSKFSDNRACYAASEIKDEKITDRFENAVLDGSDVDNYLRDRVRRRDVFMSVVMSLVWEYIFTRYLFGMDREQRSKLKLLEKTLAEVGPAIAVSKWRATTLTLLSKREPFHVQRAADTEAVVQEIYRTLATFLPPPSHLVNQILDSLRKVMATAVDLSIEMRTQRAEYMMLPPLQPEYDTNGELVQKVYFNASVMNERSGTTLSNEAVEAQQAIVRMVLFPLVVKRGGDSGIGDEQIVVCPAQVLTAKAAKDKKVVRVLSAEGGRSAVSFGASDVDMGNMI